MYIEIRDDIIERLIDGLTEAGYDPPENDMELEDIINDLLEEKIVECWGIQH